MYIDEKMKLCGVPAVFILFLKIVSSKLEDYSFPENFGFGVATSAYQIEGGFNEDGKSESVWDHYLHLNPDIVYGGSNGDVACDSYHKWEEDVKLITDLGVNFYRFSIAWTRILPTGNKNTKINEKGVTYYNNLIDKLLANGITPMVTIYHWDLPQNLQDNGGWLNPDIIEDFLFYAKTLFDIFGDRVKHWITFNEPFQFCEMGYSENLMPPFLNQSGIGGYICAHNVLLSHGRTYRLYEKLYKQSQGGQLAVAADAFWLEPKENSDSDKTASERMLQFRFGWFMHPLIKGNYPSIMIQRIDEISRNEGYTESRLPKFTESEIEMLRGTVDFIGLNHYTTSLVSPSENFSEPSQPYDCGVEESVDPQWPDSNLPWLKKVPWGLRKMLVWIKGEYGNVPIYITENGWTSRKGLEDSHRIEYINEYLSEVLKAIHEDGCNVQGYMHWSLMDNLEWIAGYWPKFGLVEVDFDNPERTRTPRKSYRVYQEIVKSRKINKT